MSERRPQLSAAGIQWVRGELEQCLSRARSLIDRVAEGAADDSQMQQAFIEMHQVQGTASMIQCYGLASVAGEMAAAMKDITQGQAVDREAIFSALLGAAIQLSDYIQALAEGMPDSALMLQPAVNELRLARGQPVLTEGEMFVAQMQSLSIPLPVPVGQQAEQGAAQQQAQRLMPVMQTSLLAWIRGGADAQTGAARIGKVAETISQHARIDSVYALWRIAAAAVEAYLGHGIPNALELKRLCGRLGVQLKTLATSGEEAAAEQVGDLGLQLLFLVGRSTSVGSRVKSLCEHFGLADLLPDAAALERRRRRIHGTSTALLEKVSEEIRADFTQVKDAVDLMVRAGTVDLAGVTEGLHRISATLGALGLSRLQQMVQQQEQTLVEAAGPPTDHVKSLQLATSILRVENDLEEALFRQMHRQGGVADEISEDIPASRDLAEGRKALYREFLVNLARVKAAVDSYLKGNSGDLPDAALQIDEIASGFEVLGQSTAAELCRRLRRFVTAKSFSSLRDVAGCAERFADVVAAIEYYIEAVRTQLPTADGILLDLGQSMDALEASAEHPSDTLLETVDVPVLAGEEPEVAAPVDAELPELQVLGPDATEAAEAISPIQPEAAAPTGTPADEFDAGEDPEIREIFLEEAAEVLEALKTSLAQWNRDTQDHEALTTLRRAFHTLKGSGRTVGATAIGEFGWGLENMLNRCLDGSVTIVPGIVDTANRAVEALPSLIDAFRDRGPAPAVIEEIVERANAYAEGRVPDEAAEPDLDQVFREDAAQKLAEVTAWLQAREEHPTVQVDREIVRAFHTLRGAARVVDANAISELSGALENFLDALTEIGKHLDKSSMQLLRDATAVLRQWLDALGADQAEQADVGPWLERIAELQQSLTGGASSGEGAAQRELAEVFSNEAFDLVSGIESQLRGWGQSPENRRAPVELRGLSHTLVGAAQVSECPTMAKVASALQAAFDAAALRAVTPQAADIDALLEVCEGLYQFLDAYRGGRGDVIDGSELVQRIEALGWGGSESVSVERVAADPGESGIAPELIEPIVELPAVAEPPVPETTVESPGPELADIELTPETPPAETDVAAPVMAPPPSPAIPDVDPELLGIFQAEAEELLETLDQQSSAFENNPADGSAVSEIMRALHTLKGSARVSGLETFGEVVHRLETLFEQVERGELQAGSQLFARIHNVLDGLHLALDDIKRGLIPEPTHLLDELDQPLADAPKAAPLPPSEPEPEFPAPAPAAPAAVSPGVPQSSPTAPPPAAAATGNLPDDFDFELVQTFAGEAEELMEIIEEALPRWQALPGDYSPARDILRALHTYKGGARMAGLLALGDTAHELESLIEGLEFAGQLDGGALRVVAGAVEDLRRNTDLLERGDYAALIEAPGESEADFEFEASVPEPSPAMPSSPPREAAPAPADVAPPLEAPVEPVSIPVGEPAVEAPAETATPTGMWDPRMFWRPSEDSDSLLAQRRETARVTVDALEKMLNEAGEISIYRSRLDEQNAAIQHQLSDLEQAIARVRDQLRQMDAETDAQIAARGLNQPGGADRYAGEFDPLEMDRYTRMQELSRALAESAGDLAAVHASLDQLASEDATILLQQGRVNTEIQQGLMRTLMVPFSRQVARLQRVVQQAALENQKRVEISFDGVEAELDRNVLERMTAPMEHLLRNAVIHGIETPSERTVAGKPAVGHLEIRLWREGSQLFIELQDDGRGLNLDAIRETAIRRGLMPADAQVTDDEAAQFIFVPGFSTARELTHGAGRGVGMDVVAAEVKQLGGNLELASEPGKGARFKVRLPLTLAMSQSLLVGAGHELYAVPLATIEGIARIPHESLDAMLQDGGPELEYGGQHYRVQHLSDLVGQPRELPEDARMAHSILVRLPEGIAGGERRIAVVVDNMLGSRQVVSKAVGPQISTIPGVSGASILADGRVVLIVDVAALATDLTRRKLRTQVELRVKAPTAAAETKRRQVMVVDDSITIRRVTERLLIKHDFAVISAKDGLDAMAQLQTERPDAILLDIEMPRADGFEVAAFVRNNPAIARTPIIMITSRSGDKHRERAAQIGVDRYLIKPFQEDQLLSELQQVLKERQS